MKIESVETFPYRLPLAKPIVMSHMTIETCENVLVKVTTDEGVVGWGEGVEAVDLTGETQDRIRSGVRFLADRIVGCDPLRRAELWHAMRHMIRGNETALGAIDIALHDLAGKAYGVPVVELLGGRQRDAVPALTMVGSGDPEADTAAAVAKYEAGYRWFKLKLAIADPQTELTTVRSCRRELGPDAVLAGDANQGWTEQQATRFLRELDGVDVAFIEQPIPEGDRDAFVRVARSSPVPICADQSVHGVDDILGFARTGVAGVSLKLVKLGGITGVMRGAMLCETLGLAVNLAGKIAESSVAGAANIHAAAAMAGIGFGCSPGNQGLAADVAARPLAAVDGHFPVPTGPGLGVDVDEAKVWALA